MNDGEKYHRWLMGKDEMEGKEIDLEWENRIRHIRHDEERARENEDEDGICDFNPLDINTGCIMLDGVLFAVILLGTAIMTIAIPFTLAQMVVHLVSLVTGGR